MNTNNLLVKINTNNLLVKINLIKSLDLLKFFKF
jgi:hypothetical protein